MEISEFEHQAPRMRQVALRAALALGLDADSAEDVAQDVMLKLWAMHDSLRDEGRLLSLVGIVARHAVADLRRSAAPTFPLDHSAPIIESREADTSLQERENERWVEARLAAMPSTESQVLRMRHLEGRSSEEIARLLGISVASVPALLSRARSRMIEQLKRSNKTNRHY